MNEAPEETRLEPSAVLCFIAATLGDLLQRIERIEAHAAGMAAASPRDTEGLIVLQDLDLIRQTTEDLARLAGIAGRDLQLDRQTLAAALRLAALRDGLLRGTDPPDGPHELTGRDGRGRVELFATGRIAGA